MEVHLFSFVLNFGNFKVAKWKVCRVQVEKKRNFLNSFMLVQTVWMKTLLLSKFVFFNLNNTNFSNSLCGLLLQETMWGVSKHWLQWFSVSQNSFSQFGAVYLFKNKWKQQKRKACTEQSLNCCANFSWNLRFILLREHNDLLNKISVTLLFTKRRNANSYFR